MDIQQIINLSVIERLVTRAGEISGCQIRVLNTEQQVIVGPEESADFAVRMPIQHKQELAGWLEANGSGRAEQTLEWLKDDLEARITSWHDVDTMAQHISENYEELNCVFDIIHNLPSLTDFDFVENGSSVLGSTANLFGAKKAWMLLQEEPDSTDLMLLHWNVDGTLEQNKVAQDGLPISPWVHSYLTGASINAAAHDDMPTGVPADSNAGVELPILSCRLEADGKAIGAVCYSGKRVTDFYTSTEAKLISTIAAHTASQLSNYRLYRDVRRLFMDSLTALSSAIESKDQYTHGHIERVTEYSVAIAERLGFDKEHLDRLRIAAMMHDLGKIGIPDSILLKDGKLTDEEFTTMCEHTLIGPKILKGIRQLEPIIPWIQGHHERQDGSGYPMGLSGDEIPLEAQIISVADAFDAMTSTRPYRHALSSEVATERLKEGIGTQFSEAVVQAFLETERYASFCESI